MDIPTLVGAAAQVGAWLILLGILTYAVTTLRMMAGYLESMDENARVTAANVERLPPASGEANGPPPPYPAPMREPDV